MRGFLIALSGLVGVLLLNQPFFSLLFLLLLFVIVIRSKNKSLILILCVIILLFSFRTFLSEQLYETNFTGEERSLEGKIIDIPFIDGNFVTFQVKVDSHESIKVNVRLKTETEKMMYQQLKPGFTCSFVGTLDKPYDRGNPGNFDYKQYLEQQGVYWILTLERMEHCTAKSVTTLDRIKQFRQKGLELIEARFPEGTVGVVQSLLFGERNALDNEILDAYQTLGLIHVLVVSGLHVGVVLAILYWILLRLGFVRERVHLLLLFFLPLYVILTGAAPSVMRAAIMAAAVIIGFILRKKLHPLESISYAFLLLLFYKPNFLYHVGFQLSFLISFGLIVSSTLITTYFHSTWTRIVAVSAIAELISIPIIMYYFHHLAILSILVNVMFVPLFSIVVLPLSFFSFFMTIVAESLAKPFTIFLEFLISFIHKTLLMMDSFSFSSLVLGQTNVFVIFLYFLAIFYLFIQLERQRKLTWHTMKYVIPFLLLLFVHVSYPYVNPYGKVTVINVGQGDSILIELPYRKAVYLIDTGGTLLFGGEEDWQQRTNQFDVGKDVVMPVLKAEGIRKVDKLILTHGDEDHIGGASAIMNEVKVNEIVYGKSENFDDNEKQLLQEAYEKNIAISFVHEGISWQKGSYSFHILGPVGHEQSKNDRSIILYTQLGNATWLFMGDAEESSENRFVQNYPGIQADVLKVGHHGSRTSTTVPLLNTVNPKVAIISVGRNNLYGHPHEDVISRLQERGIYVFRTDQDGAVQYRFTNQRGYFLNK